MSLLQAVWYLHLLDLVVAIEPVAAPENVHLEVYEDGPSIAVSWSPVQQRYYNSDSLTGYHVLYTSSSKEYRGGTIMAPPNHTKCTLKFLEKRVAYAVSVAAGNHVGVGPYSLPAVAIVGGELGMVLKDWVITCNCT